MNAQAHFSLRRSSPSAAPELGAATGSWRALVGHCCRADAVEMPCSVVVDLVVVVVGPAPAFACLHETYIS